MATSAVHQIYKDINITVELYDKVSVNGPYMEITLVSVGDTYI